MDILPRVIDGKHVFLAPERRDNVPLYWKWANDREVTRLTQGYGRAPSFELMEASYDKSAVADDVRRFGIHLVSTGDIIGRCALKNLNLIVGRGEASILIGDEKYRGLGYGTEAMRLLCTVGFDMLELHTIFLTVLACNPGARCLVPQGGLQRCRLSARGQRPRRAACRHPLHGPSARRTGARRRIRSLTPERLALATVPAPGGRSPRRRYPRMPAVPPVFRSSAAWTRQARTPALRGRTVLPPRLRRGRLRHSGPRR